MTGIGENTLAQPVKPPLRERRACLAKLVKNRLTLTSRSGIDETEEGAAAKLAAIRGGLARGVHNSKANVATARELACWVWAVGLMAEEA